MKSVMSARLKFGGINGMINYHTMRTHKIAITMNQKLLEMVDRLVKSHVFPNRSKAIQTAVEEKMERLKRRRLAEECAKLDRRVERAMAEEGLAGDLEEWPEY